MATGRTKRGGAPGPETWRGPWLIHLFRRHPDDDPASSVPALAFLDEHSAIRAKVISVVKAVASSPPPAFAGGGKWEAMHGDMAGF